MNILKYTKIFQITILNSFAYLYDMIISSFFMLIIMFIFINLWNAIYQNSLNIEGFTLPMMIWYLVITESIIFSERRFSDHISDDIKTGVVAYNLNKPYNYILFKFMQFIADAILRFVISLVLGGAIAYIMIGPIELSLSTTLSFISMLFALILLFFFVMMIGALAFWIEDTRAFYFIYQKLVFTLGGMLIPLEFFPESLQMISRLFPFQALCYLPAKLFISFSYSLFFKTIMIQLLWIIIIAIITYLIFNFAIKRLEINGG
jgi:ABC-2 type transport system permease protein